jgi:hypothetical protein
MRGAADKMWNQLVQTLNSLEVNQNFGLNVITALHGNWNHETYKELEGKSVLTHLFPVQEQSRAHPKRRITIKQLLHSTE